MFKNKIAAIVLAAAWALMPAMASASTVLAVGTDVTKTTLSTGEIQYDFHQIGSDDFSFDTGINIRRTFETQIEGNISGTGSLTIGTFVDPFISSGAGSANILLSLAGPLAAGSVTAQWGTSAVMDLSSGAAQAFKTLFTGAGPSNAQPLTISWTGLSRSKQLSANLAPVPVPAAGLLLLTALGGLGVARRMRKKAA